MNSGGRLTLAGSAVSGSVTAGGLDEIMSGGTETDLMATDFGKVVVSSGGLAISTTLTRSEQDVFGTASNTLIFDRSTEDTSGPNQFQNVTSVDRIVKVLNDQASILDVIMFPIMKSD
jgi:hypothetical protein